MDTSLQVESQDQHSTFYGMWIQANRNRAYFDEAEPGNQIVFLFFSPDGRTLASLDDDNTLRLWDVDTLTQIRTLQEYTGKPEGYGYTEQVESVSFSPDGRIHSQRSGQDNIVRLWNVNTLNRNRYT